jgi:type II secretory pathway pseudopilin PulG
LFTRKGDLTFVGSKQGSGFTLIELVIVF